jgi:hypothetical protein
MKIAMHKHSMTRWCQESEQAVLESAGWALCTDPSDHQDKPEGEVIRPKASVKTKATVTAEEPANINIQGDE